MMDSPKIQVTLSLSLDELGKLHAFLSELNYGKFPEDSRAAAVQAAPVTADAPAPQEESKPSVTMADLQTKAKALLDKVGAKELRAVLNRYGCAALPDLPENRWDEIYAEFETIGGE